MSRLGQQRDGVRQQSTDGFQAREGSQDDQRPPQTSLARVVSVIVVAAMAMIVIMAMIVVIMIIVIMIMILVGVIVAAAHGGPI